jgi:hypothetical protein
LLAKDGALIPLLTAAGEKITATPKDYGLTADGARAVATKATAALRAMEDAVEAT